MREASEQQSGTARRILLKTGDAGIELSKRRKRRTARRLGMTTVIELEKHAAVCLVLETSMLIDEFDVQ